MEKEGTAEFCGMVISPILACSRVDTLASDTRRVSGGFTDVFSLGQVLWHMLTGERPFHALSEEEISERLVEKGHPEWVAGLIHSSAQRRDRRIQTVAEFRIRLENEGELPK